MCFRVVVLYTGNTGVCDASSYVITVFRTSFGNGVGVNSGAGVKIHAVALFSRCLLQCAYATNLVPFNLNQWTFIATVYTPTSNGG